MDPKYCYPRTNTLINLLNEKDPDKLFEIEIEFCSLTAKELEDSPIKGKFDFNHLKEIHKRFFKDIYEWAGEIRTVNISKGETQFCMCPFIEEQAKDLFNVFFIECFLHKNNKEAFIDVFTEHYATLNAIHPFREGNGRAQREFARELCLECGYVFDLFQLTHKEMLGASEKAMILDLEPLKNNFKKAIFTIAEYELIQKSDNHLMILTMDDLSVENNYYYDESDPYLEEER